MALLDKITGREPTKTAVPTGVQSRIDRGRERLQRDAAKRNECWRMWRGDQYLWVDQKGFLHIEATVTHVGGGGKPPHKVRTTRNLLKPIVRQEVAYATQRVPSYQVSPSTNDPQDVEAARLAEKVALYGYDAWSVRDATVDAVTTALVAGEAFAWPYFDNQKGDRIEGTKFRTGDVCVRVFGPNEVYWEPGVRFEDSSWHCVEHARPVEEVERIDGYLPGKLVPDATTNDISGPDAKRDADNLVMVTEYLERPCPEYPDGRWLTVANKRVIAGVELTEAGVVTRPYPVLDAFDAPCLHKLAYVRDPDNDRDMGLVQDLLDAQRTYNDAVNKTLEAKNMGLNLQILAPRGMKIRESDVPGAVRYYNPVGSQEPKWAPPPPSSLFAALENVAEQARRDIAFISSQNDIPSQVEAARAIQTLIERDQNARQEFLAQLAQWHSRVMRHGLWLTARHYTEGRLLKIRGDYGTEPIADFRGSQLRSQVDVRVFPESLEPRTRQAIEQKVQTLFQLGLISPEQALLGLNGGAGERIVTSYERDIGRAWRIVQKIKAGPEEVLSMPWRYDARFANPANPMGEVPGWMPRRFDGVKVHKHVMEDWMRTEDYESQPVEVQEVANLYYEGLERLIAQQEQEAMMAQAAQAEQLGAQNAAAPQAKPLPSLPKPQE